MLLFLSSAAWAASTATNVAPTSLNALDLVLQSGWMAKFVLLLLAVSSVFSWAVIISKSAALKLAHRESQNFLKAFWQGQDLEEVYSKAEHFGRAPLAHVFKAGFRELKKFSALDSKPNQQMVSGTIENISRSLTRATINEINTLERQIGNLATIASVAPFVGLFGTVWGIMNSFQGIGASGNANLAVVAPGISEALIATAAGLGAAIPAVIAYNHFNSQIKSMAADMDVFSQDFLNLIQRNLLKSSEGK